MDLPSIECYCANTTSGNAIVVTVGDVDVYFSYRTPVAVRSPRTGIVVRRNEWGQTTGKHLNAIDGGTKLAKADRVDEPTFMEAIRKATAS